MIVIYLDLDATAVQVAWFETAVEFGALVSYRFADTGHRVAYHTQEFDLAAPAEGDVYDILKYLALVTRRMGARTPEADQSSPLQIVLSANPQRLTSLGWSGGRGSQILGPEALNEVSAITSTLGPSSRYNSQRAYGRRRLGRQRRSHSPARRNRTRTAGSSQQPSASGL